MDRIVVFGGHAHPDLARGLCKRLKVPLSPSTTTTFSNDCLGVQLQANCRQADVFIVQPLVPPVQQNLMELLLMLDAARGASAARITAVIPHFAYARSDKKDAPRISIAARLVADLLVAAKARGQRLAIATTTSHGNIDALLSRALGKRWAADFDTIVAGDDVRHKKPAPDVYFEILARLKLNASDCVAIEDSANGLIAASRANIPVLITRSMFFRDDDFSGARVVLDDLSGLG